MDLPTEILLYIFEYIEDYKKLIELTTLSKSISLSIKLHNWYVPIKIKWIDILNYILDNHVLDNYRFFNLDISYCRQLTDKNVEKLVNYHILNFSYCKQITDNSIEKLVNCRILIIKDCDRITDKTTKKLERNGCKIIR